MRRKRPAALNIGIDRDPAAVKGVAAGIAENSAALFQFHAGDALPFLRSYRFTGDELVYCDPPYLFTTRSTRRARYAYELGDEQHPALLDILTALPCNIMLSGYWSKLYADRLAAWHATKYQAMTHGPRGVDEVAARLGEGPRGTQAPRRNADDPVGGVSRRACRRRPWIQPLLRALRRLEKASRADDAADDAADAYGGRQACPRWIGMLSAMDWNDCPRSIGIPVRNRRNPHPLVRLPRSCRQGSAGVLVVVKGAASSFEVESDGSRTSLFCA
jgi:hypothetical protein